MSGILFYNIKIGDALSPSILSSINRGYQMVHSLNQLGIDAACYGNHEFDF
jgi:2',3'-cyclic-nucleotide 2'-phosphodiesterase (5'-nucleotidase family)